MNGIVVIGTVVYDQILTARTLIFPNRCNKMNLCDSIGGSMHNVAWNLSSLKAETHFITKLGNDDLALKAHYELDKKGCFLYGPTLNLPTPRFYVMQDASSEQMFCTITDDFYFHKDDQFYRNAIEHCKWGITDQDDEDFLMQLIQSTAQIHWIISGFVPSRKILSQVQGLFLNEWELLRDTEADSILEGAQTCLDRGCRWVCITRGSQGAVLVQNNKITDYPLSNTAESLNTLGCGDAFASGTLYGLLQNQSIEEAVHLGMKAASLLLETPAALTDKITKIKNGMSD